MATKRDAAFGLGGIVFGIGIGLFAEPLVERYIFNKTPAPITRQEPSSLEQIVSTSVEGIPDEALASAILIDKKTIRYVDGDTFWYTDKNGRDIKVRFAGMDAAEKDQYGFGEFADIDCGQASLGALQTLIEKGREIRLVYARDPDGRDKNDKHGRGLVFVYADGVHVNAELVRSGQAYSGVGRYGNNGWSELSSQIEQAAAEATRTGATPRFELPHDWKAKRNQGR